MFQGETGITVDDKGRLSIPTAYRELIAAQCNNRLIATYNPFEQGCLWLHPVPAWEEIRDQVNALSPLKATHRSLQLKLVGAATQLDVDTNGRVLLPQSQRAAAGIEKRAVLLGMGNKLELWSEEAHLLRIRQTIREDDVTADMEALRL
jgi:MraZ protein